LVKSGTKSKLNKERTNNKKINSQQRSKENVKKIVIVNLLKVNDNKT